MAQNSFTIGIVSPADWLDQETLKSGAAELERRGYGVKIHPNCALQQGRFAGTDQDRADAIMAFYRDPQIDALLAAKGGYGSVRLLDLLDYDVIAQHPKPLCGSSDNTTIINAIAAKSGVSGFISPMVRDFAVNKSRAGLQEFLDAVQQPVAHANYIGGNFAAFMALMGTPYLPDPKGRHLVLEEIAEPIYKIDRWFQQLWQAGYLQQLAGLRIGWFKNITDSPVRASGFSLEDILDALDARLSYTIDREFPFGHGADSHTVRIG